MYKNIFGKSRIELCRVANSCTNDEEDTCECQSNTTTTTLVPVSLRTDVIPGLNEALGWFKVHVLKNIIDLETRLLLSLLGFDGAGGGCED